MVSILMLTCGRLPELKLCIDSLMPTINSHLVTELIILDNNSGIEVIEFLTELKHDKIDIHFSPENKGVAGGRNYLSKLAKGDYMMFLDSDVIIENQHWLETLLSYLTDQIGIVGQHGCHIRRDWLKLICTEKEGFVHGVTGYCQLFRKEILNFCEVDTNFNTYGSEDTDFSLQIIQSGLKAYIVPCGIKHKWGCTNKTPEQVKKNFEYMANKWKGKVKL